MAQNASKPLDAFSLLITDTIIDEIVIHTNNKIRVKSKNYGFNKFDRTKSSFWIIIFFSNAEK